MNPITLDAAALIKLATGATLYTSAQQADMDQLPAPYNALIYGQRFSVAIPVPYTLPRVTLGFVENRGAPGGTPIAQGGRIFTVSFNGTMSDPIDLVKLAGPRTPFQKIWIVAGFDGVLRLNFQSLVPGMNALVSSVELSEAVAWS